MKLPGFLNSFCIKLCSCSSRIHVSLSLTQCTSSLVKTNNLFLLTRPHNTQFSGKNKGGKGAE